MMGETHAPATWFGSAMIDGRESTGALRWPATGIDALLASFNLALTRSTRGPTSGPLDDMAKSAYAVS